MLRKISTIALFIFLFHHQTKAQAILNGDFERISPKTRGPLAWDQVMQGQGYEFKLDSVTKLNNKYSLSIASKDATKGFGAISALIPYNFKGKLLMLKGFIKTENVVGQAGIWVRVDGTKAFDNMSKQNIHGTNDWKEYEIYLQYDEDAAININVGGLLVGTGKMWIDGIRLYLDGKLIEQVPAIKPEQLPAAKDTAYSKGSGIADFTIDEQKTRNLLMLGQVWGFVKYHHPAVAKGDFNMDAELFRVMPAVIKAKSDKAASDIIEVWVDRFGSPGVCKDCKPLEGTNFIRKPEYGRIFDKGFVSPSLIAKLTNILNNRNHTGKHYYIGNAGVGNPEFKHELAYPKEYPDAGVRLMSLFRYWNMIQYYFPYKRFIGDNWDVVLKDYIPQFAGAKDAKDYGLASMKLISNIHDTHANIWSSTKALEEYRGKYIAPFQAKFVENALVATGYYADTLNVKNKIKVGDIITAINGVAVKSLIKKYLPITAASNYPTQLRDMPRNYLLRSNDHQIAYGVIRDGKAMTVSVDGLEYAKLNWAKIYNADADKPGYYLINKDIAYVYPGRYHNKDIPDMKKLFKDTKGMIIDMRCYPSEFMPFTFVPYIKTGNAPFVKFGRMNINQPGLFLVGDQLDIKGTGEYKNKVVVIVNEESQSQAEYTTMAFQSSPNVTVIGSATAGADGNVSDIVLPGGIRTMISGLDVIYPDGTQTQRAGVKINTVVKPTIAGIKAGRDELLEKAKEIILKNDKSILLNVEKPKALR